MILWALATAWAEPLTLQEAVDHAMADNLEITGSRRENAISRWRLAGARSLFDPSVSFSAGTNGSKTPTNNAFDDKAVVTSSSRNFNASVNQALPTGGVVSANYGESFFTSDSANAASTQFISTGVNISASQPLLRGAGFRAGLAGLQNAQLAVDIREITWRRELEQLLLDVADAYWGLVAARQSRELADRAAELAQQQLDETIERKNAGFAGSGDVLQVQVSAGQARRSVVDAVANQESAEARLARMLGIPISEGASIDPTDRPDLPEGLPERGELLAQAREGNADVLLAEMAYEQSRRDAKLARNGAMPDLSLNGSVGWAAGAEAASEARQALTTEPAPSWGVGVSTQLPLFLRSTRADFGMAKLQLEQAELRRRAANQDLELAVDEALRNMVRDRAGLDVANQTLEHARLSLAAQKELLDEGRGSTRDVVDALESLRLAEASKLSAEISCQQSLLRAQRVSGTLLSRANIDPESSW